MAIVSALASHRLGHKLAPTHITRDGLGGRRQYHLKGDGGQCSRLRDAWIVEQNGAIGVGEGEEQQGQEEENKDRAKQRNRHKAPRTADMGTSEGSLVRDGDG